MTLFFSLPFEPIGHKNAFCSGHVALALADVVYQVFDPDLLHAPFLFSMMPLTDWLYARGRTWVDRNPSSPLYTHVYLYGKGESIRTVIYSAGFAVNPRVLNDIDRHFETEEERFRLGANRYSILRNNCSSILAEALAQAGFVDQKLSNRIPSCLFREFVRKRLEAGMISIEKIACQDTNDFRLHRVCAGLRGFDPQRRMDEWARRLERESREGSISRRGWEDPVLA